MSTQTKKRVRSEEARKRRNQKKKQKARSQEDSPERPHLLPTPYVLRDSYDYVAIDCEMIAVEASLRSEKQRLASVGIVDNDGVPVYDAMPPSSCRINKRSRKCCPVTNQQFAIARRRENTDFAHVRSQVLAILRRYVIAIVCFIIVLFSRDRHTKQEYLVYVANSIPLQVENCHWPRHCK